MGANHCHIGWDRDACQASIRKCFISDRCHTVWNREARQPSTIKCLLTDGGYVRDIPNASQFVAILKRRITDRRYTVRNRDLCHCIAVKECIIANACHAVSDVNRCNSMTILKRSAANRFHVAWDRDARQVSTRKCFISNLCHTVWNRKARQASAKKCLLTDGGYIPDIFNACQAAAILKRRITDRRYTVRNHDLCHGSALKECIIANACHAVFDDNLCNCNVCSTTSISMPRCCSSIITRRIKRIIIRHRAIAADGQCRCTWIIGICDVIAAVAGVGEGFHRRRRHRQHRQEHRRHKQDTTQSFLQIFASFL